MSYRENFDLSLYFVVDPSVCAGRLLEDVVCAALRGGVSMVQLRNKIDSSNIVKDQAILIRDLLADSNVPFIINDYVELAAEIGADGVHIGQDDMSAVHAREIVGPDAIVGVTAFTREHYDIIDASVVDYVGTGPFYATKTKPDKPVLGADGFADLIKYAPVPVVGIGGITLKNAHAVMDAGADGIAMMRSISEAENVEYAARDFLKIVREAQSVCS